LYSKRAAERRSKRNKVALHKDIEHSLNLVNNSSGLQMIANMDRNGQDLLRRFDVVIVN
jgi:hypothetical protein